MDKLSEFLSEVRNHIGSDNVLDNPDTVKQYEANMTDWKREVLGVCLPSSRDDVVSIVIAANRFNIPLHPISRGRNWGLGSKLPTLKPSVIVDLKHMNRIHSINREQHYAVIEPGVTQQQLYDYLKEKNLPFIFNIIGSSSDTSLIGNALERGVGYFHSRVEDISGMEIVLGTGKTLKTGFGHYPQSRVTYEYPHGVGPSLDGLFFQSNFGIVTQAAIALMPMREARGALICKLKDENRFHTYLQEISELRKSKVLNTVVHIGNRQRTRTTIEPLLYNYYKNHGYADAVKLAKETFQKEFPHAWSAIAGIMGSKPEIKHAIKQTKRKLKGIAEVSYVNDRTVALMESIERILPVKKSAVLNAIKPLYLLSQGVPTDAALKSLYWSASDLEQLDATEPDLSDCGMIYCLPICPLSAKSGQVMTTITQDIYLKKYGFDPAITLNTIDDKSIDCVINILFNKTDPKEAERAQKCMKELHEKMVAEGFIPYRVGLQYMDKIVSQNEYWKMIRKLKQVFDPNGIISPGRYNLV